jgi:hypothetical protein
MLRSANHGGGRRRVPALAHLCSGLALGGGGPLHRRVRSTPRGCPMRLLSERDGLHKPKAPSSHSRYGYQLISPSVSSTTTTS